VNDLAHNDDSADEAARQLPERRAAEFRVIAASLGSAVADEASNSIVAAGDSLELLKRIPDRSVSLILTDPPYHSTKKQNITGDRNFEEDDHFLDWMAAYAVEWERVLKLSGTAYVFCSSQMSARLEVRLSQCLRPINNIAWAKPNEPDGRARCARRVCEPGIRTPSASSCSSKEHMGVAKRIAAPPWVSTCSTAVSRPG
jgi:hypothetical protein